VTAITKRTTAPHSSYHPRSRLSPTDGDVRQRGRSPRGRFLGIGTHRGDAREKNRSLALDEDARVSCRAKCVRKIIVICSYPSRSGRERERERERERMVVVRIDRSATPRPFHVAAVPLSAACAKCGRNSNPPLPWNFLPLARSTNYEQPAVGCGPAKRETTAPHGKLYRRAPLEQIDFFFQFRGRNGQRSRELGRREGVARDKTRVSKVDCERRCS